MLSKWLKHYYILNLYNMNGFLMSLQMSGRELNFYTFQVYACLLHMNLSFLKAKKMIC